MPKLETPEECAENFREWMVARNGWPMCGDRDATVRLEKIISARDAAIRAESAALLKTCGEKIEQALREVKAIETYDAACTLSEALAALREAGV